MPTDNSPDESVGYQAQFDYLGTTAFAELPTRCDHFPAASSFALQVLIKAAIVDSNPHIGRELLIAGLNGLADDTCLPTLGLSGGQYTQFAPQAVWGGEA